MSNQLWTGKSSVYFVLAGIRRIIVSETRGGKLLPRRMYNKYTFSSGHLNTNDPWWYTIQFSKSSFANFLILLNKSRKFIILLPCSASRRCSWQWARKWRRKEPIAVEGFAGVDQRRNNRLSLRSSVSRGRSSRSLWSRIGFAFLLRTTRNWSCL